MRPHSSADALLDELEALGSKRRTFSPAALESCESLLACPAVVRRVPASTPIRERARAARAVVLDAIAGLDSEKDRLIAAAVLCTEPEYEDKYVKERVALLGKEHGGNWRHLYDDRRPRILEQIVRQLLSEHDDDIVRRLPSYAVEDLPRPMGDAARVDMSDIGARAAQLFYSVLASRFVERLDRALYALATESPPESERVFERRRLDVLDTCAKRDFEAYVALLQYAHIGQWDAWAKWSGFNEDALAVVVEEMEELVACAPAQSADARALCLRYAARSDNQDIELLREFTLEFLETWLPWHRLLSRDPDTGPLVTLGDHAGFIAMLIARLGIDGDLVFLDAKRFAHKTLAYYYDFQELSPSLNGRSLRDHSEIFFEREMIRIASRTQSVVKYLGEDM